jgi:putative FmdB family regulatory protein
MPLYEYFCPPCSTQFEILRPMSQMDNPAVCPSGHTTNNRVLSLFAPVMHGASEGVSFQGDGTVLGDCCATGLPGHVGCSCC